MQIDYLIVGSGLTGAVIARDLIDTGNSVLIVDRRKHYGGNVFDHVHPSGIRVHTYGPHYFRTNDDEIWNYVNRFSKFFKFEAVVKTLVDGRCENWPISSEFLRRKIGPLWEPAFRGSPANFEDGSLALMPQIIYEKFVKNYTQKQWGIEPKLLSANLARRFDVRENSDERLFQHKHQGIPIDGYAQFMCNIIAGIPILLNFNYLNGRNIFQPKKGTIFTGPIDEFFNFDIGKLQYRGQKRLTTYHPDIIWHQPCGQINNPNPDHGNHIRTLEWKHMMQREFADRITGTVLTTETPFSPSNPEDFEYPFPSFENSKLYRTYREKASLFQNLLVCGRLGEYRYYDMDQSIARARLLASRIINGIHLNRVIDLNQ